MTTPTQSVSGSGVVLNLITKTVANVTTRCMNEAASVVNTRLSARKSITIENCDINISAGTIPQGELPSSCSAANMSVATDGGQALSSQLQQILKDAIKAKSGLDAYKSKLILNITNAVSSSAVATCAAIAVNNVTLRLNAADSIIIDGCNIQQQSSAMTTSCIHNVLIDGMPMNIYLKQAIDDSGKIESVTDPSTGKTTPALPNCPTDATVPRIITFVLAGLFIFLVVSFFLLPIYYG